MKKVMLLDQNNKWHDKKEIILLVLAGTYHYRQCRRSGSAWIRINLGRLDPDPDPGEGKNDPHKSEKISGFEELNVMF